MAKGKAVSFLQLPLHLLKNLLFHLHYLPAFTSNSVTMGILKTSKRQNTELLSCRVYHGFDQLQCLQLPASSLSLQRIPAEASKFHVIAMHLIALKKKLHFTIVIVQNMKQAHNELSLIHLLAKSQAIIELPFKIPA